MRDENRIKEQRLRAARKFQSLKLKQAEVEQWEQGIRKDDGDGLTSFCRKTKKDVHRRDKIPVRTEKKIWILENGLGKKIA